VNTCTVDAVPLALVLPVATLAFAFGVLVFIQTPTRMEEVKGRIRGQIGADPATGVPFRPSRAQKSVLDFDVSRRLRRLPFWLALTVILPVAYLVASGVPKPWDGRTYACIATVGSVVTLVPPVWVVLVGVSVLVKLRESPRQ
jgi:hypothetical protein